MFWIFFLFEIFMCEFDHS